MKAQILTTSIRRDAAIRTLNAAIAAVDHQTFFLASIAVKVGTYRDYFRRCADRFPDDHEINVLFETLKTQAEAIIFENTANGTINAAAGLFALKAYHGLIEVQKVNLADASGNMLEPPIIKLV
jgi:hypothetical protein